jgi:hypothetical protein
LTEATGADLGSTTAAAATNEMGEPFDLMPILSVTADDPTRPWEAISTLGNPEFDRALIWLGRQYTLIPGSADWTFSPSMIVR